MSISNKELNCLGIFILIFGGILSVLGVAIIDWFMALYGMVAGLVGIIILTGCYARWWD